MITLAAIDPDSSANNVILYRVLSSVFISQSGEEQASPDVFTLRGASGALYPALPSYQSFSGGRFSLRVQAIDAANPEFTDTVQIFVSLLDKVLRDCTVVLFIPVDCGHQYSSSSLDCKIPELTNCSVFSSK